jgi:hypothetical protein
MPINVDIAGQIKNICSYAKQAQQEVNMDKPYYQKYVQTFTKLLINQIPEMDTEKKDIIAYIVDLVYTAYDDMSNDTEKLAAYIETLVIHLQDNPNYLQHWSVQSIIDSLVDPELLKTPPTAIDQSIEEYVQGLEAEMDEAVRLEHEQTTAMLERIRTVNDLLDQEDEDRPVPESFESMHAAVGPTQWDESIEHYQHLLASLFKHISIDEDKEQQSNLSDHSLDLSDHISEWDGTSLTTSPDDRSEKSDGSILSLPAEDSSPEAEEFAENLDKIIQEFLANLFSKKIKAKNIVPVEKAAYHVIHNLVSLYAACFQEKFSPETLQNFEKGADPIIKGWAYNLGTKLPKEIETKAAQAFTKIQINLRKSIQSAKQDLDNKSQSAPHQ